MRFSAGRRLLAGKFFVALCSLSMLETIDPSNAQTGASPFGFTIQVSLSPKALKKLTEISEGITVRSNYYGKLARKPTKADIKRALANGEVPGTIDLVGDTVTLTSAGGVAEMPGRTVKAKDAADFGSNPVNVNINVFSARNSASDNLLQCSVFDDTLAVARTRPIAITCQLIDES